MKMDVKKIAGAGILAALYVALVYAFLPLASGTIQLRVAEALCILPVYSSYAIPGVTLGCFLANLLTGCAPMDVIFGTLATFLGAVATRLLRKFKALPFVPPVFFNALIIPFVLRYAYEVEDAHMFLVMTVGIGEVLSVGLFGGVLKYFLDKNRAVIPGIDPDYKVHCLFKTKAAAQEEAVQEAAEQTEAKPAGQTEPNPAEQTEA